MIYPVRDHPVQVLFGIAIWVLKNAVVNAHGQSGDVAGGRRDLNALIESSDVRGLKPPTAGTGDVDALGVNVRTSQQIIEGTNAVPDFPAGQVCAGQISQISYDGMLGTNQVVTAFAGFCVPELAAFAFSDGIPGNRHIAPKRQALTQSLVMSFTVCRVAAWNQHPRMSFATIFWHVHQCSDVHSGQAFKDQFFNMKTVHRNLPGYARVERRFFGWKTPKHG